MPIQSTGVRYHASTRLMSAVYKNNISDWIKMEASPYVRFFGLASSNNITASLKE